MKNKMLMTISFIFSALNIFASISLKNWYAMMGWFVAVCMCIYASFKELKKMKIEQTADKWFKKLERTTYTDKNSDEDALGWIVKIEDEKELKQMIKELKNEK